MILTIRKMIGILRGVCFVVVLSGLLGYSAVSGQQLPENILRNFHYRSIGPTRQAGRMIDVAVPGQEKQPYTFYVATTTGGLWKTTDNGITYTPIFDHENVIAIGDIAVAPTEPNTVWVGSGSFANWGDGVYKSTDGGRTWNNMGLRESHHIFRVIVHPRNPDIVYVAAMGHSNTENPERGVFTSTNGGRTWVKSLDVRVGNRSIGAVDLVMNPRSPEILYAAAYDRQDGQGSGIFKTTDAGNSWTKLTKGLPEGGVSRICLDVYRRDPSIVYAGIMGVGSPSGRRPENVIYRSDDAGSSWRRISQPEDHIGAYTDTFQIRVDPNDPDRAYVLNGEVQATFDGGETWIKPFRFGGDNKGLWIDPENSSHMIMVYDYGMGITYSGGKTWYHPDNLPLAQLYAIGVDMDYPYNVYGGMQDFGSWKGPSTKKGRFPIRFEDWEHVLGGDGFYNQVDPANSRWLYTESQNGGISRNDQKTGVRRRIRYQGNPDIRFNWNAPILISPHNSNVIYHGANVLLRSPFRGDHWEEISPDLSNYDPNAPRRRKESGTISTIDESPVMQGVIWAGTDDGNVQLTRDGGKTWSKLNDNIPGYPGYRVSRVTASHHDAGTAYVTFTGVNRDDFRAFVYKTTDFGQTWESIVNNLPDESVNVIREDRKNPNLLFLGTDKAVYVTIDGGKNWARMRNNMPNNIVNDLVIHPRENDLVVGTYGRGFFITDISPLQEVTPGMLDKDVYVFAIEPKVQWVMPSQPATGAQNFAGENEAHGVVINYYLKKPVNEKVRIDVFDGSVKINELTGPATAGLNSVEWPMTKRRKRTAEEIAQWERREERRKFEQEFFDYYDTVDFYLDPDDEVTADGRSMRTRVHDPGPTERDYRYQRVLPGEYLIVLTAGSTVLKQKSIILPDYWYDKQ